MDRYTLNQDRFQLFLDCYRNETYTTQWIGHIPSDWTSWINANGGAVDADIANHLPNKRLNRKDLIEFINDKQKPTEACAISTVAWGGMKRTHGAMLLAKKNHWLPICEKLRAGEINRSRAYCLFMKLREDAHLNGMGPAYFTKLIFFLHPDHDGYIMDQWTASSINILFEPRLVNLTRTHYVTDNNTPEIYENFCSIIENLADKIGLSADQVEEKLFSRGGQNIHPWRKYVRYNRNHL